MGFFNNMEPPDEGECPKCPKCGQETDTFYVNGEREIIGCGECIRSVDAYYFW